MNRTVLHKLVLLQEHNIYYSDWKRAHTHTRIYTHFTICTSVLLRVSRAQINSLLGFLCFSPCQTQRAILRFDYPPSYLGPRVSHAGMKDLLFTKHINMEWINIVICKHWYPEARWTWSDFVRLLHLKSRDLKRKLEEHQCESGGRLVKGQRSDLYSGSKLVAPIVAH